MWITHLELESKISSWWNIEVVGTAMYRVAHKLKNVKRNIKIWNKSNFGHIFQDKDDKSNQLYLIQEDIQHNGYNDRNR